MNYEEIYKDHCYLWDIGPASDMTGGYVDQEDLDKLLAKPTKATAKECLLSQITYWFQVGIDNIVGMRNSTIGPQELEEEHPKIKKIAEKYGINY